MDIFFHFLLSSCFIEIALFSYVTKWESLTAKIGKWRKRSLVGSTPRSWLTMADCICKLVWIISVYILRSVRRKGRILTFKCLPFFSNQSQYEKWSFKFNLYYKRKKMKCYKKCYQKWEKKQYLLILEHCFAML